MININTIYYILIHSKLNFYNNYYFWFFDPTDTHIIEYLVFYENNIINSL